MDSFLLRFRRGIIPGSRPVAGQTAFAAVGHSGMPESLECDKGCSKLQTCTTRKIVFHIQLADNGQIVTPKYHTLPTRSTIIPELP